MIRKDDGGLWSPPIWVDFNDLDGQRLRLRDAEDNGETARDLRRYGIQLADGLRLTLYTLDRTEAGEYDDLVGVGVVRNDSTGGWIALIAPSTLCHVSELDGLDRRLYLDLRPEGFQPSFGSTVQG